MADTKMTILLTAILRYLGHQLVKAVVLGQGDAEGVGRLDGTLVDRRVVVKVVDDANAPHVVVLELGLDPVEIRVRLLMNHVTSQSVEFVLVVVAHRVLEIDDVHRVEVRLSERSVVLACVMSVFQEMGEVSGES